MSVFFDFVILVIFAVFAYMGARRGFIREVFRFAGMAGGFIVAYLFYGSLQSVVNFSSNQQAAAAMAFVVIFLAAFLAIVGVGLLVRKFTKMLMLGWFDGALGLVLGLFKAALITWVACLSISSMPFQKIQNEFGRSKVYKTFCALPDSMRLEGLEKNKKSVLGKKSGEKSDANKDDDILDLINKGKDGQKPDESDKSGDKKKPEKKDKKKQQKTDGKGVGTDV